MTIHIYESVFEGIGTYMHIHRYIEMDALYYKMVPEFLYLHKPIYLLIYLHIYLSKDTCISSCVCMCVF